MPGLPKYSHKFRVVILRSITSIFAVWILKELTLPPFSHYCLHGMAEITQVSNLFSQLCRFHWCFHFYNFYILDGFNRFNTRLRCAEFSHAVFFPILSWYFLERVWCWNSDDGGSAEQSSSSKDMVFRKFIVIHGFMMSLGVAWTAAVIQHLGRCCELVLGAMEGWQPIDDCEQGMLCCFRLLHVFSVVLRPANNAWDKYYKSISWPTNSSLHACCSHSFTPSGLSA